MTVAAATAERQRIRRSAVIAALRAVGVQARTGYFGGIEIAAADPGQLAALLGVTAAPDTKENPGAETQA